MKQNVQKHNRMKLWIGVAIIIALFIAVLFYGMYLYRTTLNSKYVDVSKTKNFILENNYLESIEEMDAFYEAETYHIFAGRTKDKKEAFVFLPIPYNDKKEIITIFKDDIINKTEAIHTLFEECSSCTQINIKPAMINNKPLWELTYRDGKERYNFDYISMEDGSRYERLQLKQTFK